MIRLNTSIAVSLVTAAAAHAAPAAGPSFPCAKTRTQVERAICADPTLSGLDLSLETSFRKALADNPAARQDTLDEQRRWIAGRGGKCGMSADAPTSKGQTSCLVDLYAKRIADLARPTSDDTPKRVQTLRVGPDGRMTVR